jgi:hypothetical protein
MHGYLLVSARFRRKAHPKTGRREFASASDPRRPAEGLRTRRILTEPTWSHVQVIWAHPASAASQPAGDGLDLGVVRHAHVRHQ